MFVKFLKVIMMKLKCQFVTMGNSGTFFGRKYSNS